jgi:glutaredoxin
MLMLASIKNRLRALAYQTLVEADGHKMHPVAKHLRNAVAIVNELLPDPLRLEVGRPNDPVSPGRVPDDKANSGANGANGANGKAAAGPAAVLQAPVFIYFDGRDHRTKGKIEELLTGQRIAFKVLDVTDDEAERSWVTTAAHSNELPIVVIAGTPIGGLAELTQLNLSGELQSRVFGLAAPQS